MIPLPILWLNILQRDSKTHRILYCLLTPCMVKQCVIDSHQQQVRGCTQILLYHTYYDSDTRMIRHTSDTQMRRTYTQSGGHCANENRMLQTGSILRVLTNRRPSILGVHCKYTRTTSVGFQFCGQKLHVPTTAASVMYSYTAINDK
jgi:hypothetical protein